jgi:hypothetical protein
MRTGRGWIVSVICESWCEITDPTGPSCHHQNTRWRRKSEGPAIGEKSGERGASLSTRSISGRSTRPADTPRWQGRLSTFEETDIANSVTRGSRAEDAEGLSGRDQRPGLGRGDPDDSGSRAAVRDLHVTSHELETCGAFTNTLETMLA